MSLFKKLPGTVGTFIEFLPGETKVHTSPLATLNAYVACEGVPLHWTKERLAELSSAIAWALNEIPPDVLETQAELEKQED